MQKTLRGSDSCRPIFAVLCYLKTLKGFGYYTLAKGTSSWPSNGKLWTMPYIGKAFGGMRYRDSRDSCLQSCTKR